MYTKNVENVGNVNFHEFFDSETFTFRHKKLSEVIPKDSVVLDIGSHVGYFSLLFGSCIGENGKVIAFEPNPKTYNVLVENSKNNPNLNIIPYNSACTPETKKYIFNYSDPTIYNNGMNGGYFDGLKEGDNIKNFH